MANSITSTGEWRQDGADERDARAAATHLHDRLRGRPHGLESRERVPECERRLHLRTAVHQLHGSGNETDLAGEVNNPVDLKQKSWRKRAAREEGFYCCRARARAGSQS